MVNNYTQYTKKSLKYSFEGEPNVCRTAATMARYCVVSGLNWTLKSL
jgi:hypothetical protein